MPNSLVSDVATSIHPSWTAELFCGSANQVAKVWSLIEKEFRGELLHQKKQLSTYIQNHVEIHPTYLSFTRCRTMLLLH